MKQLAMIKLLPLLAFLVTSGLAGEEPKPEPAPAAAPARSPDLAAVFKEWEAIPDGTREESTRLKLATKVVQLGPKVIPELISIAAASGTEDAPIYSGIAILALGELLENDTSQTRKAALQALLPVASGRKNYENKRYALKALENIGDIEAIAPLVPTLDTSQEVAATIEIRDHQRTLNVTARTLAGLSQRPGGAEKLVEEFAKHQEKASDPFKVRMIQTLREVDSLQGESMLLFYLSDKSDLVRYNAISALGYTKPRQAPAALMEILRGRDTKLKKGAMVALGRYKWVPAIPELSKLLDSPESGVKPDAVAALRLITGLTFSERKQAVEWHKKEMEESQKRFDGLVAELKAADKDSLPIVIERFHGIVLQRDRLYDLLLPYASHENFRARAVTCTVLGRSGVMQAWRLLTAKINDSAPEVSYAAWRALKESTGRSFAKDATIWNTWLSKRG
jgi:hypothetical protein